MHESPICWGSRSQKCTTLSSSEAEYVAIGEIVKEILYIIQIMEFLKMTVTLPVVVHVDNIGAIYMSHNAISRRTKHIDTRFHLVREHIEDGILKIQFVRSCKNTADIFTKNTSEETYVKHTDDIMVKA